MTKIKQGFPDSHTADHQVQTSRPWVPWGSYNQVLRPPQFCTEPCPMALDGSRASRLCGPQMVRNFQVVCLQKTPKRRLLLLHDLAPALSCQHLCRCWKAGHGLAGPSWPPWGEFGGPITCFTDQASPPGPTTGVDVPVGNLSHHAVCAHHAWALNTWETHKRWVISYLPALASK